MPDGFGCKNLLWLGQKPDTKRTLKIYAFVGENIGWIIQGHT